MNWDDLRHFLAVARCGSISGAARQLGVRHSTVSRRMRQLEEKLGARLLERKPGGYELTDAGINARQAAERMESEVLSVDGEILGSEANLVGPLRVSAINNMASSVLMPIFASFCDANPQINLELIVSNSDVSLAQREADVAIRLTNTPTDRLIGKRLVTVASAVYGSKACLAQAQESNAEPKWIGVECCQFHKSWTRHACENKQYHFISDDTLLTLSAIREGLGISYLPCFMADSDPLLARYHEPDPDHNLGLWILIHPDLKRNAKALAFRRHMISEIAARKSCFEGTSEHAS